MGGIYHDGISQGGDNSLPPFKVLKSSVKNVIIA